MQPLSTDLPNDHGRLLQLQTLLLWEGRLNNSRLRDLFGLSSPRASVWIRELRECRPDWMIWDARSRSFVATSEAYAAKSEAASLERYIGLVGLVAALERVHDTRGLQAAFPSLMSPVPAIFGPLNRAIQACVPVEIVYASMQNPEPHIRVIHPHSLVRTDQRWHVRGYCEKHQDYRDFNLGRIREVRPLDMQTAVPIEGDTDWNTFVPVRFIAHPDLTDAQAQVVRQEFFGGAASRVEPCRGALVHYFVKSLQASLDPEGQLPPDYLLSVFNVEEIRPWLFPG